MKKFYLSTLLLLLFGGLYAQVQILAPLPAHSSTFTGNVRGYWFQAPECFTITGLEVASEAGAGSQNIAVCRLYATPPIYPTTTNAFTTLFVTQNNPATGIIPVNLQIEAGDYIMIIGQRSNINSYSASGSWTTTIEGITTNIYRSGMQYPLNTTLPQELWAQASGSVSRVHMYYDSVLNFTAIATPSGPNSFTFTNGADSSFATVWDYGDGSALDSSWNGSHTYSVGGTFNVCSYITTGCGTDTVCTQVTVCGADPVSAFAATPTGFSVAFTDSSSNATSWMWDFGDGTTDTTQNPTHTYNAIGWYYVCLITTNACAASDTLCDSVFVCVSPTAAMTYVQMGRDTLVFTDGSTYPDTWLWDFGDGNTSTLQNPMHIYGADGTYIICLTVTNLCGTSTVCDTVTVCVTPLLADFSASTNQFTATFTNNSAGATAYSWTFGDGNTDTTANPSHTYAQNGLYVVCLTTTNDCGESMTVCDSILIDVIGVTTSLPGFDVAIAPNPMQDRAMVTVHHASLQGQYTFKLMDVRGAVVHVAHGTLNTPMALEVSQLAQGFYMFSLEHEGIAIGTGRIVVE